MGPYGPAGRAAGLAVGGGLAGLQRGEARCGRRRKGERGSLCKRLGAGRCCGRNGNPRAKPGWLRMTASCSCPASEQAHAAFPSHNCAGRHTSRPLNGRRPAGPSCTILPDPPARKLAKVRFGFREHRNRRCGLYGSTGVPGGKHPTKPERPIGMPCHPFSAEAMPIVVFFHALACGRRNLSLRVGSSPALQGTIASRSFSGGRLVQ